MSVMPERKAAGKPIAVGRIADLGGGGYEDFSILEARGGFATDF